MNVSGMDAAATFVIHVIAWGGVAGILVGLIDRVRRRLPSWRNGVMVSPAHTRRRRSFAGIFIPLYGGVMAFMSWGVIQQARDAGLALPNTALIVAGDFAIGCVEAAAIVLVFRLVRRVVGGRDRLGRVPAGPALT